MNIMFITQKLSGGGAERVTATLASALSKENNVYILTNRNDKSYEIDKNVNIICLNVGRSTNFIQRTSNLIKLVKLTRKYKKNLEIDCAISLLASPNLVNVLSKTGEKTIISVRNKISMQYKGGISKRYATYSCKHSDLTVALSKRVRTDLINNFSAPPSKVITIYNPCNIQNIEEKSFEKTDNILFQEIRSSTDFLVVTAGRLTEQKAQWHMIRAFSKVVKVIPNAKLVILGEGELEEYLKMLIVNLGLQNNVYLLGFHVNPYPYMAKSDVFVFSSLFEGFGNILLEAMACNLPIISCDCDAGPRELLAPSTDLSKNTADVEYGEFGILVPMMDGNKYNAEEELTIQEETFAKAICEMHINEALKVHYVQQSKKRVQEFSVERIVSQWDEIIR